MKKIHEISSTIDQVIETINPLDSNNLFYSEPLRYIENLNSQLLVLNQINMFEIESEIWERYKELNNEKVTTELLNSYFSELLSWKNNISDISNLIISVNNDISTLSLRVCHYNITASQVSSIKKIYLNIALKLFNLILDYIEIVKNFSERIKASKTNGEMAVLKKPFLNYMLKPEKVNEIALYINAIIENEYFMSVDPQKQFTKIDILNAVGFVFSCEIQELNSCQLNEQGTCLMPKLELIEPTNSTAKQNETETYPISSFLLHTNKQILAHKLKEVFHTEKGKSIRLLMKALEENQPALLCIGNRQFKSIYNALHDSFKRDIGSYQSVKGYVYNEIADKDDFHVIKQKLNHILSELSN